MRCDLAPQSLIFGGAEFEPRIALLDAVPLTIEPRFYAMDVDGIKQDCALDSCCVLRGMLNNKWSAGQIAQTCSVRGNSQALPFGGTLAH
mmetsp:Transcript_80944/g.210963  ORF Transcript_80944/g.210963 Transcript_80944/m.210963 type:complete len:90 (-) Transcript_80944:37-306(-)